MPYINHEYHHSDETALHKTPHIGEYVLFPPIFESNNILCLMDTHFQTKISLDTQVCTFKKLLTITDQKKTGTSKTRVGLSKKRGILKTQILKLNSVLCKEAQQSDFRSSPGNAEGCPGLGSNGTNLILCLGVI